MEEEKSAFEYVEIAASNEIKNGERLVFEVDGTPIILFRVSGRLYAISGICSHDDHRLDDGDLEGYEITCPAHGARFDIRDGKVKALPAINDIDSFPVREVEGRIEIGLPN
jgi:3-phenylpropionate/trans-cinnamate dioxygenase ferredoxin subunit